MSGTRGATKRGTAAETDSEMSGIRTRRRLGPDAGTGTTPAPITRDDGRGGFEISVNKAERLVHMKLWGIWNLAFAKDFYSSVRDIATGFSGERWGIVADSRNFSVQSPDVTNFRQMAMTAAGNGGCDSIAAIGSNAVYSMQFKRITGESHVGGAVFEDEAAAFAWIRARQREAR